MHTEVRKLVALIPVFTFLLNAFYIFGRLLDATYFFQPAANSQLFQLLEYEILVRPMFLQ